MSNAASWRRRCLAAEERAEKAERSVRRLKSRVNRVDTEVSMLSETVYVKTVEISDLKRTLSSIARYHLGPDSTPKERTELCRKWAAAAQRRRKVEDQDLIDQANAEVHDDIDPDDEDE